MAKDPDPKDFATQQFEVKHAGFTKNRTGCYIRFELDPTDLPREISDAQIGQRWYCVLVPMPDDMPEPHKEDLRVADAMIRDAGMLCKRPDFQDFLGCGNEEEAAKELRKRLRIGSRTELRTNPRARKDLHALITQFTVGDFG